MSSPERADGECVFSALGPHDNHHDATGEMQDAYQDKCDAEAAEHDEDEDEDKTDERELGGEG